MLRLVGIRPARATCLVGRGRVPRGGGGIGVLGSCLLVVGLSLAWWQLLAGSAGRCSRPVSLAARAARSPDAAPGAARGVAAGSFPSPRLPSLAVLAVDAAVQPIWNDDAWAIWAAKAESIVLLGGLDPDYLASASVLNPSYPLVVPVLELVALRFCGLADRARSAAARASLRRLPVRARRAAARPGAAASPLDGRASRSRSRRRCRSRRCRRVADVPLAVFFALAGVAGWRWVETASTSLLWLAGVFAAAAVGTKVEGGVFVALLGRRAGGREPPQRRSLRLLAIAPARRSERAAVGALVAGASTRQRDRGRRRREPRSVGRIPSATGSILRELADPSSWLALVALALCRS